MHGMPSRHDHFPRADAARRVAMRRAVADLDAAWRAADTAPDGLLTVIAALVPQWKTIAFGISPPRPEISLPFS